MLHDISGFDFIFLSYDEPNAEELYADLLNKVPWAKRVHGVKGFDAAHKECARVSTTDMFVTVDGDNRVHGDFLTLRMDIDDTMHDHAWSWNGRNVINGLIYGNGGLKLWSKRFVDGMCSHENTRDDQNAVDFCWDERYHDTFGCYSTTVINASPYQAFRAGFREGVKLSLNRGQKVHSSEFKRRIWIHNLHKLSIWCSVGMDVANGEWAIYGARLGLHMTNLTDWDYVAVRDYDWFERFWKERSADDPIREAKRLGFDLRSNLGLELADLDPKQSSFFKSVYLNPSSTLYASNLYSHVLASDA